MATSTKIDAYSAAALAVREQRIVDHLPLVRRIAGAFSSRVPRTVDSGDLVSAGTLGLIRAVDGFDPDRGAPFETYAKQCIRGAILDHLRAQDPLPYSTRVKIRQVETAMLNLQKTLRRMPDDDEVAHEVGFSVSQVSNLMAQGSSLALYSLDEFRDQEDAPVCDATSPDALASIERREMKQILSRLIRHLPRSERLALSLYYYEGLKMKEISSLMNITESRVSQIHARAVTILRAQLREMLEQRG
jgi:RNA polymerase sigma factor for flagellar operon FliA